MKKYWRDRARTSEVIRGRWLVTGDLGSVSEDGFLTLVGRASEVINRGGEKVSPLQVEAALSLLPEIAEAAVVGAPHPIFGERVVAFVALRDRHELDADGRARAARAHGRRLRRSRALLRPRSPAPRLDRQGRPPRALRICRGGRRGRVGALLTPNRQEP